MSILLFEHFFLGFMVSEIHRVSLFDEFTKLLNTPSLMYNVDNKI